MSKKTLIILIVLLVIINIVLGERIATLAGSLGDDVIDYDLLTSSVETIRKNYVDPDIKTEDLIKGALNGMLKGLDQYSQYMDPKAHKEMEVETSGKFGGLGIHITKREGFVTVIAPIHNTPAARVGLQAGDKIVAINGKRLKDPDLMDVVQKLRGDPGTKVTITILREPDIVREYTITRAIIKVPSIIDPKIIDDNIGYIKISQFQKNTADDLEKALQELTTQRMDSLILDLRYNPGGLLISAVEVVDKFIPRGQKIVSTRGKGRIQTRDFSSKTNTPYMNMPMVVLIDGGSASASEIVAGALRDLNRAILVGEKSFGKGSVQTIIPLETEGALRLTTAKYYTPSNISIHDKGIEPDIEVKITSEELENRLSGDYKAMEEALKKESESEKDEAVEDLPEGERPEKSEEVFDPQLKRAIEIIKALKIYKKSVGDPSGQKISFLRQ